MIIENGIIQIIQAVGIGGLSVWCFYQLMNTSLNNILNTNNKQIELLIKNNMSIKEILKILKKDKK
jgi:cell division protein YceG involved in septum cleavage